MIKLTEEEKKKIIGGNINLLVEVLSKEQEAVQGIVNVNSTDIRYFQGKLLVYTDILDILSE